MTEPFPYQDVVLKLLLSLTIGLLVGMEREWAQKEAGVRTFSIIAILGALTALLSTWFVLAAFFGVLLLIGILNVQSLRKDLPLKLTTSAALMVTLVLGVLIGLGHFFTATAASIFVTMLLSWKLELSHFAEALKPNEIRGAVLLGLLTFVVYPILPDRFVDPWELLNPRAAWVTVVVISGIGFCNYVLLRLYGTRGLYYAALLGGLVNSTAAVSELSTSFMDTPPEFAPRAVAVLLLTSVSMFARNLALLAVFAPQSVNTAILPMLVMTAVATLYFFFNHSANTIQDWRVSLSSPVSLFRVLKFGILFVLMAAVGTLVQRHSGDWGFLAVSAIGGLVSSASTTATAAMLAATGTISPEIAGLATVCTSAASTLVNLPLVRQQTHSRELTRRLALVTIMIVVLGMATGILIYVLSLRLPMGNPLYYLG